MYFNESLIKDGKVNVMNIATRLGIFMSTTLGLHESDSDAWDDIFESLEATSKALLKSKTARNTGIMLEAMCFAMDGLLETYEFKDKAFYELRKNISYLKDGIRDGRIADEFAIVFEAASAINKRVSEEEANEK